MQAEDERYEIDNKIQILTFGVSWLEQIINPETPEDKAYKLLERVIKLKVNNCLFIPLILIALCEGDSKNIQQQY